MARVGIVCDSTCDLGLDWFAANDVEMVPLKVQIGEETFLDWVDLAPEEFYERQKAAAEMPTTSQPTPAEYGEAYAKLAAAGCEEIVCITLTAELSGTNQSANIAAGEASIPVHVIDTLRVSVATGLVVKVAVEARDSGKDAAGVLAAARSATDGMGFYFVLDTLDYLVKGGRAGKAQGLAASLLNIKPILTFEEGIIVPFKKAKGLSKAFAAMAEKVAEDSAGGTLRIAFMHAIAPEAIAQLKDALDAAGIEYVEDSVSLIGSVIGNYAGAGAVGLAYVPESRG